MRLPHILLISLLWFFQSYPYSPDGSSPALCVPLLSLSSIIFYVSYGTGLLFQAKTLPLVPIPFTTGVLTLTHILVPTSLLLPPLE